MKVQEMQIFIKVLLKNKKKLKKLDLIETNKDKNQNCSNNIQNILELLYIQKKKII